MAQRQTKRQRDCERIAKHKAKKKLRRQVGRRCLLLFGGIAAVYAMGGGFWMIYSGHLAHTVQDAENNFYRITADAGFTVKNVYLDGRQYTPMEKIQAALEIKPRMPIFAASPQAMRERLESIDRVAGAEVERVLPDTLHIRIIEREPVAIWQNNKTLRLIDPQGHVMEDMKVEAYGDLPVLVGEDAATHAAALFAFLLEEKELVPQIQAAIRVGERRWNIKLKNGIEIKLPERNPEAAWKELARMQSQDKVLERAISTVDMRLSGKVFLKMDPQFTAQPVKTPPGATPHAADVPNAKET